MSEPSATKDLLATKTTGANKLFTADVLREQANKLAHFSAKTVNSNITENVGIRLGIESDIKLPYLSVRTIGAQSVLTDFVNSMTQEISATNFMMAAEDLTARAVVHKTISFAPPQVSADDATRIYRESRTTPFEKNTHQVPRYLRQLYLPKGDSYVCVSPISAAGVSKRIGEAFSLLEKDPNERRIPRAVFGVGGSNPQNIGALGIRLSRPLFFDGPHTDSETRQLFAQHISGVQLRLDSGLHSDFVTWWNTTRRKVEDMPSNHKIRERVEIYFRSVVVDHLREVARVRVKLTNSADILGTDQALSAAMDPVHAGALDPAKRSSDWAEKLATMLLGEVRRIGVVIDGTAERLLFDQNDDRQAIRIMKGALL